MRRLRRCSARSLPKYKVEERKPWSELRSTAGALFQNHPDLKKHCEQWGRKYNVMPVEVMRWYFRGNLVEGTEIFDGIHNRLPRSHSARRGESF